VFIKPPEEGIRIQSSKCCVLDKRTMDNVQNFDRYINTPPSQTYRKHLPVGLVEEAKCVSSEVRTNLQNSILYKRKDNGQCPEL
jgi:hypothetical protein